uniref:Uncharacterized protein n=1 Tax=Salix viminalis TaxID=40686 RepID=A0A6N2L2G4_SALVM
MELLAVPVVDLSFSCLPYGEWSKTGAHRKSSVSDCLPEVDLESGGLDMDLGGAHKKCAETWFNIKGNIVLHSVLRFRNSGYSFVGSRNLFDPAFW